MAKANRVIQKPKPPAIKHVAVIDPSTGLISAYASGTNIVIGDRESKRNWRDITNVPGASTLNSENVKRILLKDGQVKRKPRVRLIVDARKIEIGRGRARVSYEVLEGTVDELKLTVKSNGTSTREVIDKNQTLDIGGSSRRRVIITLDDPTVFVEEPLLVVDIVPPDELITPPVSVTPVVPSDIIVEKGKKNGQVKRQGN